MSCADCYKGFLHDGTPTGRTETVYGFPTYVAEPAAGTTAAGVIVIVPDAYGWELPNNRILADNYARKGPFRVLLPDFMNGSAAPASARSLVVTATSKESPFYKKIPAFIGMVARMGPFVYSNRPSVSFPRVLRFMRSLRADTELPVGAAGFCWGGKHVTLLSAGKDKSADGTRNLLDRAYTAHPSMIDFDNDYEDLVVPMSIAVGIKDAYMSADKVEQVQKLFQDPRRRDITELVTYEGAIHGFAVRGDPGDETAVRQGIEAEDQAVRWFQKMIVKA